MAASAMVAVAIVAQRVNKNARSGPHTRKKGWILIKSRQISDKKGERTFVLIYEAGKPFTSRSFLWRYKFEMTLLPRSSADGLLSNP